MGGWVYIMANAPCGVPSIGVTAFLAARIDQHCRDKRSSFCSRHGIHTLVYAEPQQAIAREKTVKAWQHAREITLIEGRNPDWRDLFDLIA